MAQTPSIFRQEGGSVDYTPVSAVTGGDVVVVDSRVYIAKRDIAASTLGSLASCGIFRCPKDTSVFAEGDAVYWNATGSPVVGTASSGAMTVTAAGNTFAGYVIPGGAALTGGETVDLMLSNYAGADGQGGMASATVAATGSTQTDAAQLGLGFTLVSAADATKGVKLPGATPGAICVVKNGDVANAILKLYPATSDAINALSANAALSMAAKTSALLVAYDTTTWYTVPLLPS